jgi:trans-2,3-dihydro-3-hydroxyanthranilate isomerase
MGRRFVTLDVFTDARFAGNPLAVVLESEGLETAAMQAVAREFNHPETVFVLPPADPSHRARLRIFTPARELPFAGHPTVGTAVLLGRIDGGSAARELVVEEGIGPIHCRVEPLDGGRGRATFTLPQLPSEAGAPPADAKIAAALGVSPSDLGSGRMRPSLWSAGMAITFVPVGRLAAVRDCRPEAGKLTATFGTGPVYLFCAEAVAPGHAFHARMFAPALGVPEDPATGAAAAALTGLIAAQAGLADGEHAMTIEQGYEMGRPSLIHVTLTMRNGKLAAASVGGDAVVVTEGVISV